MTKYPENAVCICEGVAVSSDNPIYGHYGAMVMVLVVDPKNGIILDVEVTSICKITSKFIASLLCGLNLSLDLDRMVQRIDRQYYGQSKKSLLAVLNACAKKYAQLSTVRAI